MGTPCPKKTQVKALNHRSIHIHHQHFDNNWQHLNHPTHPNLAFVLEFGWMGHEHVDDSSAKNHGDKNLQDVSHQHVLRAIMQLTRRKINSGSSEVTKKPMTWEHELQNTETTGFLFSISTLIH